LLYGALKYYIKRNKKKKRKTKRGSTMFSTLKYLLVFAFMLLVITYVCRRPIEKPEYKALLGRSVWIYLHALADFYEPGSESTVVRHINDMARLYPCGPCRTHMQLYIQHCPVTAGSKQDLVQWVFDFHNSVNKKLGKAQFAAKDYSRSESRLSIAGAACPDCTYSPNPE
jgi:hypothetical protein